MSLLAQLRSVLRSSTILSKSRDLASLRTTEFTRSPRDIPLSAIDESICLAKGDEECSSVLETSWMLAE